MMQRMKKVIYIAGLGLAFLAGGFMFALGSTNWLSANPGGADDPLVTRSFVDARISEVMQLINAQGQQVNTEIIVNEILADITGFFGGAQGQNFTPVHVNAGQTILGGEGVEIIRRSGAALAHVPGSDGIVNATTGLDLDHGHPISANQLLIIPRQDGRGIRATQDSWFIIRGDFTIVTQ